MEMGVKVAGAEMAAGDATDLGMKQTGRAHSIFYHLDAGCGALEGKRRVGGRSGAWGKRSYSFIYVVIQLLEVAVVMTFLFCFAQYTCV